MHSGLPVRFCFPTLHLYNITVATTTTINYNYNYNYQDLTQKKPPQTFALLVSVTNFALVVCIVCRVWASFVGKFTSAPGLSRKAAVGLLGAALLLLMVPASFIPYNLTRLNTSRLDENVFIHCKFSPISLIFYSFFLSFSLSVYYIYIYNW